nr:hypothetical protein [Tanacetum cinerariifolium]
RGHVSGAAHAALPRHARQAAGALPREPRPRFQPGLRGRKRRRRAPGLAARPGPVWARLPVGALLFAGARATESPGAGRLPAAIWARAAALIGPFASGRLAGAVRRVWHQPTLHRLSPHCHRAGQPPQFAGNRGRRQPRLQQPRWQPSAGLHGGGHALRHTAAQKGRTV